jgi:hypothetical protein
MRRRAELIAACAAQRVGVSVYIGALAKPIALADRGLGVLRYLRSHPLLLGALTAALVVARRRGFLQAGRRVLEHRGALLKWGQRGLLAWRTWQAMRSRRKPA